MRPDNWRFTGFHADGCTCRGHSPPGSATFCWAAGGCGFGCGGSVGGLMLSWQTDYPTSFWIAVLGGVGFLLAGLVASWLNGHAQQAASDQAGALDMNDL